MDAQGAYPILLGTGLGDRDKEWKTGRIRTQLPYDVTTLEGFIISVREYLIDPYADTQQVAATGLVVLTATVTKANISR